MKGMANLSRESEVAPAVSPFRPLILARVGCQRKEKVRGSKRIDVNASPLFFSTELS
jgi:hypothetical protein